jgi:hypothetical protein
MGLIITPNTGSTTYPNISDINDIVTINPSVKTYIISETTDIRATDQLVLRTPLNMQIIAEDTLTITSNILGFYGSIGVAQQFSPTNPSGGPIQDTEARTAINSLISILQNIHLIQ